MKINMFLVLFLTVFVSGCAFFTDPFCLSLDDVELAREKGTAKMESKLEVDKLRANIKATAEVKKWKIYRDLPSDNLFVIMNIPGFIDTTEVGVWVEPKEEGGCVIEVASLNPKAQKVVADELFSILKLL